MSHKFSNTKIQREKILTKKAKKLISDKKLATENDIDFWFINLPLKEKYTVVATYAGFLLAGTIWKSLEKIMPVKIKGTTI